MLQFSKLQHKKNLKNIDKKSFKTDDSKHSGETIQEINETWKAHK